MTSFTTTAEFDSLVIFESLRPEEIQTGTKLREDIESRFTTNSLRVAFNTVRSKEQFVGLMRRLVLHARDDRWRPILHVEIHGSASDGLQLWPSGEFVSWDEFAAECRPLVDATDNNLVIVMAVCHGFEAITRVSVKEMTPFTFLVGPDSEVSAGQVLDSFGNYYRKLLESDDFANAHSVLPTSYGQYNCERVLVNAYARHIRQDCRGRGKQERLESLLTQIRQRRPGLDITSTRRRLRELVITTEGSFEMFRTRFLLSDRRSNSGRFTVRFEDVLEAIEQGQ